VIDILSQADNPVVYASDGFVKVTGYNRSEVIPRNCRFLQGPQTDRTTVRRVQEAIRGERETVELILNYKKSGAPFWNLLYIGEYRVAIRLYCAPMADYMQ
jgi:PAS domain S-box-containing protein